MMADETKGPTKEEVLPMMEKRAKKRNWRVSGEVIGDDSVEYTRKDGEDAELTNRGDEEGHIR